MATFKQAKIGVYGTKTRLLQKKLSYEKTSLTWKSVHVWKYLGSRTNGSPAIGDIPDPIFLEVADRAYDTSSVEINVWWDIISETMMDLSKFGFINPIGDTQQFRFHSYSFEADGLGRDIVIGDILEVPFLEKGGKDVFFEVTDVDFKQEPETYTVIVTTTPMKASQETTEITTNNSNDALLDQLQTDITTQQEADFTEEGFDLDNVVLEDEGAREAYDPRPDEAESFLDDPFSKSF